MATKICANILYLMAKGDVDLDTDALKWIIMGTGFTYSQGSHHEYADISASEYATGEGYTVKTKAAAGISISRNDTLYKLTITWSNPSWTATGGDLGPMSGAFLIDDTVTDDPLVMYIDFEDEITEPENGTFTIASPTFEIKTASS